MKRLFTNSFFVYIWGILVLLAAVSVIIRGFSWLYPAVPVLLMVGIFAAGRGIIIGDCRRVMYLMLPFGIWATLTSFWSFYSVVSLTRGLYYLFLVTGLTALVYHLKKHGITVFELLLPVNVLIIFASLFSLLSEIPSDGWTAGNAKGFMGLFSHQNSLGAILLFTFPGWLYLHLLIEDKKASEDSGKFSFLFRYTYPRSFKYFFAAGFVLNILLLTLTHSRASILFLFVMLSLYLFLLYRKNVKRLAIGSALLILMFFSVSAVNPVLVKNSLLGNSEKAATNIQEEQVPPKLWGKTWYSFWYKGDDTPYSTRQHIFADSWKAAQIGGLFGIGYGISHPNIKNNAAGSRFDESGRYIREKGNSFLAMVEEVGGVGLGLFLLPVFFFFRFFFYNSGELFSYPKLSIFLLLILFTHAQFEAWMTGVHSPLLFVYICLSASFQTQSYLLLE